MKYQPLQLNDLEVLPRFEYERGADYEVCSYPWDLKRAEDQWKMGYRDEAWHMMNLLLRKYVWGYPGMVPYYHEKVLKRMSKLLNREGRFVHAFGMAIAAHYCRLAYFYRNHNLPGIINALDDYSIEKALLLRAKKANAIELLPRVQKILSNNARLFPQYRIGEVLKEIDKLLQQKL